MLVYWDCMPRIQPLSITSRAEGHYMLWTWKRTELRNYGGDWGWYVVGARIDGFWNFWDEGRFRMFEWWNLLKWSIFWAENELLKDLEWCKLLDGLNDMKVLKVVLGCLDTRHYLDGFNFDHYNGYVSGIGMSCIKTSYHPTYLLTLDLRVSATTII